MDTNMLNLINNVSEDDAKYLYKNSDEKIIDNHRSMDLYFAHNGVMAALGYLNGKLVWFSYTGLRDKLLSRRIFDCMKFGAFYRETSLDTALAAAGMTSSDLQKMCHAHVEHLENNQPIFTGCISSSTENREEAMTGVEFADSVISVPASLKAIVPLVGTDDDIIAHLEKDYQLLEALYGKNEGFSPQKQQQAKQISAKWQNVDCLKMADRAAIRTLYYKVRYHRYTDEPPDKNK